MDEGGKGGVVDWSGTEARSAQHQEATQSIFLFFVADDTNRGLIFAVAHPVIFPVSGQRFRGKIGRKHDGPRKQSSLYY
jgi:hypothetical protein